ncbi:hypothetical protein STENO_004089 [Stenotrophomonas maltophilia]
MADIAVAGHQPGAVAVDAGRGDVDEAAVDLCLVAQGDVQCPKRGGGIEVDVADQPRVIHGKVDRALARTHSRLVGAEQQQVAITSNQLRAVGHGDIELSTRKQRERSYAYDCAAIGLQHRVVYPERKNAGGTGQIASTCKVGRRVATLDAGSVLDGHVAEEHAHAMTIVQFRGASGQLGADEAGIDDGRRVEAAAERGVGQIDADEA